MTAINDQTNLSLAAYPNPFDGKDSHLESLLGDSAHGSPRKDRDASRSSKKIQKSDSQSIVNSLKTAEHLLPERYEDLKTLKDKFRAKADDRMKRMQESQKLVKCHKGSEV